MVAPVRQLYRDPAPVDPDRFAADRRFLVGLAAPVNVLSSAKREDDGRWVRTTFDDDAFRWCLWELDRGLHTVGLWLDHDPARSLGTTDDGFFRVYAGPRGLQFAVDVTTARGAVVRELLERRPDEFGEVSIGYTLVECAEAAMLGGVVVRRVQMAVVDEISLVSRGSMPSTWIR